MVLMGFLVGQWMGWKQMDSIFRSDPLDFLHHIILKTFEELGVKAQKFAGIVIGSSLFRYCSHINDGSISTVAVSQQFSGIELVLSVLKLIFFLTIWFVRIFFIPTLLKKAKHLLTDEMMLIISLALCLMVILASNVGFSLP
jgi:CPA2 family monovalent cation:H+ antiporter-2